MAILNVTCGRRELWRVLRKAKGVLVLTDIGVWEEYLRSLYQVNEPEHTQATILPSIEGWEEITTDQVEEALKILATGKAADEFGLKAEHFKLIDSVIMTEVLATIFTGCVRRGKVPPQWNRGLLHPLFKVGDFMILTNYRTITIINIMAKILSTILNGMLQ